MPRELRPKPVGGGSERPPESSRRNPAYNTSGQSEPSHPEQGLTAEHNWRSPGDIDALARQSQRPRVPTHEESSFDVGTPYPNQESAYGQRGPEQYPQHGLGQYQQGPGQYPQYGSYYAPPSSAYSSIAPPMLPPNPYQNQDPQRETSATEQNSPSKNWTPAEDAKLVEYIKGEKNYQYCSENIKGRSLESVRSRWRDIKARHPNVEYKGQHKPQVRSSDKKKDKPRGGR